MVVMFDFASVIGLNNGGIEIAYLIIHPYQMLPSLNLVAYLHKLIVYFSMGFNDYGLNRPAPISGKCSFSCTFPSRVVPVKMHQTLLANALLY